MTDLELHHHDASGASRRDLASRTGPTVVLLLLAIATLLSGGFGWFMMISLIDATGWATMGETEGEFLSVFAIGGGLPCLLFAIRTLAAGPIRPLTVGVAWFAAASFRRSSCTSSRLAPDASALSRARLQSRTASSWSLS